MTSNFPTQPAQQPDTGPLSWVMSEIQEALAQSAAALQKLVSDDGHQSAEPAVDRSTLLRQAKTALHQAHGALQMVDINGVTILTEALEALLDQAQAQVQNEEIESDKPSLLTAEHVAAIAQTYQALIAYLEELLTGAVHQPVKLFPYYAALMAIASDENPHPAALFFPDLSIRPQFVMGASAYGQSVIDLDTNALLSLRKRFEMALLPFLKSSDNAIEFHNATLMQGVIAEVEQAQTLQQSRAFWWVMQTFAEGVASAQIDNALVVKQLFAQINIQLRRLSQGSLSISERLLRDALFFIAGVQTPSASLQKIRQVYRLEGMVPANYRTRHYDQVNPAVLQAAKENLNKAKNMWDSLASGNAAPAQEFEQQMRALSEAGSQLNITALSKLLRELSGISRHAAYASPGDAIGLEIATSLLFIENTLSHIHRLPENFSERADAMSARLLTVMSGEIPADAAHSLGEIYQAAQQRQSVKTLANEMLTSLRQVEKMLDEYFSEPTKRAVLTRIDHVLHQIQGALSILDVGHAEEDAGQVITHTRATLQQFSDAEKGQQPQQVECERLAQNIGALSFFLEAIQHQSGHAGSGNVSLSFDQVAGVFKVNLLARREIDKTTLHAPVVHVDAPKIVETKVETEVEAKVENFAPLFPAFTPDVTAQITATTEEAATTEMLPTLELLNFPMVEEEFIASAHVENAAPEIVLSAPMPITEAAVDAELLEIFLSEADEVFACIRETLSLIGQAQVALHNQEHHTVLHRAFHTLKGSSRMIGLTEFGEAAWSIEQVLNLWLSESKNGTSALYVLLDEATRVLSAWIAEIQATGKSARTPDALILYAQKVRDDQEYVFSEGRTEIASALEEEKNDFPSLPELVEIEASQVLEASEASDADLALFADIFPPTVVDIADYVDHAKDEAAHTQFEQDADNNTSNHATADVIAFPGMLESRPDDNTKKVGDLLISLPLYNIYLAETDQLARLLTRDFSEWQHEPERSVTVQAIHAAHSLAGSSATVGFKPLQELAHALEMLLQRAALQATILRQQDFDTLAQVVERAKVMLQEFSQGEMPYYEPALVSELNALLHVSRDEVRDERQDEIQNDSEENNGETGFEIAVENTPIISSSIVVSEPAPTHAVTQVVPVMQIAATVPRLFTPTEEEFDASLALRDDLDADLLPVFLEEGHDILPQIGGALRDWQQEAGTSNNAMPVATIQAILRHLHTIKGSARMAGAMVLGQHMHEMESQIEVISQRSKGNADSVRSGEELQFEIEELLTHYDHGVQLFDNLHLPKDQQVPLARSAATVFSSATSSILSVTPRPVMATSTVSGTPAILTPAHMPVQAVQQVRVNADILDRLVNQAGEVSITRSRLESGVGHLQQSLSELTENVDRLRQQLREIEMQAETQMSSRMSRLGEAGEREFDPLEFDRFTRLQELTRMMAESVNDVGMLQKTLTHTANDASATLVAQGLLTRDLQQDLMHVRMVQFASVAERLYRLTRQVSKEVDKRVTLDIRGSSVEMDRGVLEKMVGPFEHLLRNAIVHGIESRDARRAAGKNDIGELKIEIRQDGNEVLIQLTDDGQGLNLPQIREKAHHTGLLSVDQAMDPSLSDGEISELIFKPGFSTASEVTELAGRGVGMDVVRSEATSLGGRVAVSTQTGEGTTFSIHLPLTLAVMQVVIFTTGGATYAVPSALVEQVQQLKSPMLAAAYNDGAIQWQGQRVPMHYLSALLGEHDVTPVSQQYSPIVILKSGNERVAVHVDAIAGNREVVVKNIGPQLSRMIGIVGATVLGSGDIVLILNPVPLALRYAQEVRAPRTGMTGVDVDAVEDVGAVAEIAKQAQNAAQGLRTQKIVMVVDDSLTVRRVTQRLLLRESYQVVLAKDGVDALQQLQAITPDVMLVDIEMPRMDGFDLTRNIRSDERTRHIPIIMITSRTATKHRDYAMELGVNEYLGKPYQEDALLSAIKGFVQRELML